MRRSVLSERYRVIRRLGRGATGEVLLGEHLLLARLEAIKILRRSVVHSPRSSTRFRREARALSRLEHPNVVAIYDFGRLEDKRCFISMEYAHGQSLDALLRKQAALSPSRVLRILAQIADAVDHAHSRGVIHRDLKPANVVLTRGSDGAEVPKVLDFGFAKITAAEDGSDGSASGAVGTPYYMAPELLSNRPWDSRVDIYSLGCMAFELLAGTPPFEGPIMTVFQAHISMKPPRLSDVPAGKNLPGTVSNIIYACMAKDPEARVPQASLVAEVLRRATAGVSPDPEPGEPDLETKATMRLRRTTLKPATDSTTTLKVARPKRPDPIGAIAQFAGALLDEGCDSIDLVLGRAELVHQVKVVERCEAELDLLYQQRAVLVRFLREQEGTQRLALADLEFVIDKPGADADACRLVEEAVARVSRRLDEIRRQAQEELEESRQVEASLRDALREGQGKMSQAAEALGGLVEGMAGRYLAIPRIHELWRELLVARKN